jgi:hypothetical protein
LFSHGSFRAAIYRFAFWSIRLLNLVDERCPEVMYLLPESFVEVPFEIFRAFKRGCYSLYETETEKREHKEEYG